MNALKYDENSVTGEAFVTYFHHSAEEDQSFEVDTS
jgi:hypothetical protein